jgi:hypothetical protein
MRSFALIFENLFVCRPEKPDHEHDETHDLNSVDFEDSKNM